MARFSFVIEQSREQPPDTGRLGLIDFDRFACSEPEFDLATLLIDLRELLRDQATDEVEANCHAPLLSHRRSRLPEAVPIHRSTTSRLSQPVGNT